MKRRIVSGIVIDAIDYNPMDIVGDLPTVKRSQIVKIRLEENVWNVIYLKNKPIKIIIEEGA